MSFADKFPQEFRDYLKKTYGNNEWWLSEDPLIIAYHQMNDLRLAVPPGKLQWALEQLLERPVWSHQLAHRDVLKKMNLYFKNGTQSQNLCYEDLLEMVNKKWQEAKR